MARTFRGKRFAMRAARRVQPALNDLLTELQREHPNVRDRAEVRRSYMDAQGGGLYLTDFDLKARIGGFYRSEPIDTFAQIYVTPIDGMFRLEQDYTFAWSDEEGKQKKEASEYAREFGERADMDVHPQSDTILVSETRRYKKLDGVVDRIRESVDAYYALWSDQTGHQQADD